MRPIFRHFGPICAAYGTEWLFCISHALTGFCAGVQKAIKKESGEFPPFFAFLHALGAEAIKKPIGTF